MEATVMNYRRGKNTQNTHQMIIHPAGSKNKEDATKLIGKTVEWTTTADNKLQGKITKTHGSNGAVVAQFPKGLPGQAIGTKAKVL
ncbi:MAG: 50S ribosomal protein L35ae [Candidatus Altiarchaeota archaeon]